MKKRRVCIFRYRRGRGGDATARSQRTKPHAIGQRHGARRRSRLHQNPHKQRPSPPLDPQANVVQFLRSQKANFSPFFLLFFSSIYNLLRVKKPQKYPLLPSPLRAKKIRCLFAANIKHFSSSSTTYSCLFLVFIACAFECLHTVARACCRDCRETKKVPFVGFVRIFRIYFSICSNKQNRKKIFMRSSIFL